MNLRTRIRQWFGITEIQEDQTNIVRNQQILFNEHAQLHAKVKKALNEISIHNRALARFIAKLDPMFAEDDMSPERKAASDKITDAVIRKLIGEHLASRPAGDLP